MCVFQLTDPEVISKCVAECKARIEIGESLLKLLYIKYLLKIYTSPERETDNHTKSDLSILLYFAWLLILYYSNVLALFTSQSCC